MKPKYEIVLKTDGSQWTKHFVYCENIDEAKRTAVNMAERMGGSFLDIISVSIAPYIDDKKGF